MNENFAGAMNSVLSILGRCQAVVSIGRTRRPLAARRQVLGEHHALSRSDP